MEFKTIICATIHLTRAGMSQDMIQNIMARVVGNRELIKPPAKIWKGLCCGRSYQFACDGYECEWCGNDISYF